MLVLFSNVTAIHVRYNIMYYRAGTSYSDLHLFIIDVFIMPPLIYLFIYRLPFFAPDYRSYHCLVIRGRQVQLFFAVTGRTVSAKKS